MKLQAFGNVKMHWENYHHYFCVAYSAFNLGSFCEQKCHWKWEFFSYFSFLSLWIQVLLVGKCIKISNHSFFKFLFLSVAGTIFGHFWTPVCIFGCQSFKNIKPFPLAVLKVSCLLICFLKNDLLNTSCNLQSRSNCILCILYIKHLVVMWKKCFTKT